MVSNILLEQSTLFVGSKRASLAPDGAASWDSYRDECLVVAHATGPHAQIAASFAVETALWGYKLIRQRPFYWDGKEKLLRRIFRSTNIALWQKQREDGFTQGLTASVAVILSGPKNYWIGVTGDMHVLLCRDRTLTPLTQGTQKQERVGKDRYGLVPETGGDLFLPGDMVIVLQGEASQKMTQYVLSRVNGTIETEDALSFVGHQITESWDEPQGLEVVGIARRLR